MPNRLAEATSPYLLQHKDNPVDWWEWGPEAFAEAKERQVPVLLSVGYAACHWCHVMAHESFEDEATAAYLNEHFVSVKVDREERPDVDAVYMQATTSMTGHGGWPMTCVLDHEGNPFFAGTYFPDQPRHGSPSFRQVLEALVDAWDNRGDDVRRVAGTVRDHLNQVASLGAGPIGREQVGAAVQTLSGEFDPRNAGFGGAPKFPPSMVLEFLLRDGSAPARQLVDATCEAMARGGLYDQLGGGFARYSVDAQWVVPHFEKMLYDNAQLLGALRALGRADRRSGSPPAPPTSCSASCAPTRAVSRPRSTPTARVSRGSSTPGRPAELVEVLGDDDGAWAAQVFEVTEARHVRARSVDPAAARPTRRAGCAAAGARPGAAARGPRDPGPPGA